MKAYLRLCCTYAFNFVDFPVTCLSFIKKKMQKDIFVHVTFASDSNYTIMYFLKIINEPAHDKTNKMSCVPRKDSVQPGHPPSLIRVFAVRMKKAWVLSYPLSAQQRIRSDWADAQADLSLCWAHSHFVFVLS